MCAGQPKRPNISVSAIDDTMVYDGEYISEIHAGVPKPGGFWVLTPPTFLEGLKNWSWRGNVAKIRGAREKFLGRVKNF